jgi:hypothetical protein
LCLDEQAGVWGDWRCFVEGVEGSDGRGGVVVVGKTGREWDWGIPMPLGVSAEGVVVAGFLVGREGVEVDVERYISAAVCQVQEVE